MLVVFFAVMLGVGIYCRKNATDVNGFVLGGRSVGPWLTAFAYGTSYFSAVGYAGQFGWKYGIAATWAGIGNALLGSLMAWAVLGRRTRVMTQHLDSATMPQFFQSRFNSKSLKLAASAVIFIFLIPYTASLYNGLSRLFGMAFDIDYSICILDCFAVSYQCRCILHAGRPCDRTCGKLIYEGTGKEFCGRCVLLLRKESYCE